MPPRTKKAKAAKMHKVMGEFKRGKLHSGSATGPKVKKRSQAIAIGMKQSGQSREQSARRKRLEGQAM